MTGKLSDSVHHLGQLVITKETLDEVVQHPEAIRALELLDIHRGDHEFLSDILDPDNSGSVSVLEMVDGIRRLRGEPRRSDIVCVDLMMRAMQVTLEGISDSVNSLVERAAART